MPIRNPDLSGFCFFAKSPPERRLCSFLRDLCASRPRSPPLHIAAFSFARARSARYKPSLFPAEFPRPHADILFRRAALFRQKSLAPFFPDPPSPLLNASFLSGQAARRFVSRKKSPLSPLTFPMPVPFLPASHALPSGARSVIRPGFPQKSSLSPSLRAFASHTKALSSDTELTPPPL